MKKKIHPKYHKEVQVVCSCGNTFVVGGATLDSINIDFCYKCHPAYTGEKKVADTASRIQKFTERTALTKELQKAAKGIKEKKAKREKAKKVEAKGPITLKDVLKDMKSDS